MKRCLIVDDNENNRYLLQVLLKGNGYEVETAGNGAVALEKARSNPPDLVISDVLMPVMDGFMLCRELRRDDRLKTIPIIIYTATYTDKKDEDFALSLGADRFLVKPLGPEMLMKEITAITQNKAGKTKTSTEEEVLPEPVFLKEYNETLVRKLEDKMLTLEKTNRLVEKEITEHKAAEKILKETALKFKTIFDSASDGILLVQPDARKFITANTTVCKMLGYTEEEILRLGISDIHEKESLPHVMDQFEKLIKKEISTALSIPVLRKDRTLFFADITASTVLIDGKECIMGFFRDVTERKKAEENIRLLTSHQDALISAIPDIIMEVDVNKHYTWANKPGIEFFGEDVIGKPADFYFAREQNTYDVVQSIFNGSEDVIYLESWQRRKDRQERLLAWWCRVLKDTQGNVTGALSSARDVTERRQAEERLRESEDKFRYMFDHSVVGNSITFLSGQVNVNKAFCDMLGYSGDELSQIRWQEITHPEDIELTQREIDQILSGEKDSARFIKRFIHKNGSVVWTNLSSSLRRDKDGKPLYLMTTIVNITERKKVEEEIKKLNEELEQRVTQRTAELMAKTAELERINRVFVDRELRMRELKEQIAKLENK